MSMVLSIALKARPQALLFETSNPRHAHVSRLMSLSIQIGVGQSLRQLKKQKGLLRKLISAKPYQPDDLLEELQPFLDNQELIISGFHLFSFNDVERTENWRAETFKKINM